MNSPFPNNKIIARQSYLNENLHALADQYDRTFNYLRLSITDACNYRCNYCLPDGYQCTNKNTPLTLDEITNLVTIMAKKGIRKVRITGGEPSVRKDLVDIIKAIKNIQGIETVALTTNGYKLDKQIKSWINAGLDALNVSIDSLNPDKFYEITGKNRLAEILNGLELAEQLNFKHIKINAVLLKQYNYSEFDQFMSWIKHKPYTIRFIELMETGDNTDYFKANHLSGRVIENQLMDQGWQAIKKSANAGPAIEYSHPDYNGRIGLIMPYSKDFCKSCNRLRVSSQGKLHLCLFGEKGYDLKPFLSAANHQHLDSVLDQTIGFKQQGHDLSNHKTGSTRHLAMLGG